MSKFQVGDYVHLLDEYGAVVQVVDIEEICKAPGELTYKYSLVGTDNDWLENNLCSIQEGMRVFCVGVEMPYSTYITEQWSVGVTAGQAKARLLRSYWDAYGKGGIGFQDIKFCRLAELA